jgi:hypothetical protein
MKEAYRNPVTLTQEYIAAHMPRECKALDGSQKRDQALLLGEFVSVHVQMLNTLRTLVATGWRSRALFEQPADTDLFFQLAEAQQLLERIDASPALRSLV